MKQFVKSAFLYVGLLLSFILVLTCLQLYNNTNALFGKKSSDSNYWITLSKTINPDNIGRKELIGFNAADCAELKSWKEVKDIYPVVSNDFKVSADGGSFIPFYTDINLIRFYFYVLVLFFDMVFFEVMQNFVGPQNHRLGHTRNLSHVNTKTMLAATFFKFPQKHHFPI